MKTSGGKTFKNVKTEPKRYRNKKISAMSSAYWMSYKSYGDFFYTPKSLPLSSENSKAMTKISCHKI